MKLSVVVLAFSLTAAALAQTSSNTQPAITTQTTVIGTPSQQTLDAAEAQRKKTEVMMQAMVQRQADQANCPVELTSASFAPYYMPVDAGTKGTPGDLDLGFRNLSGKPIASVQLKVHLLVKRSVYDMQAYPLEIALTAHSTGITDRQLDQLQHLALPTGLHPTLVKSVTLAEVTYADGSSWLPALSPSGTSACGLNKDPMQFVAK